VECHGGEKRDKEKNEGNIEIKKGKDKEQKRK
jgi:hypothetical protein